MKKVYVLLLAVLCAITSINAQVTVTATAGTPGPTAYTNLSSAFTAINAGTHQGAITVGISASFTDAAVSVLNSSGAGAASYTSVLVRPTADGVVMSFATATGRGVIELNGADNVTIDGDNPNTGGTNRNLTITNTAANTITFTSCIRLATSTLITSCDNDIIRNCNLNGSGTGRNIAAATSEIAAWGIVASAGASTAAATTAPSALASATTTMPSGQTVTNLNIDNNNIQTCSRGIAVNGAAATVAVGLLVTNNVVGNTTVGATDQVTGIGITVQGTNNGIVRGNTVRIEGYVQASAVNKGIDVGTISTTGLTNMTVEKNFVERVINNDGTSWPAYGINIVGGTNHIVQNNFVGNCLNSQVAGSGAFSTTFGCFGIRILAGTGHKIYHNSVHFSGVVPGSTSTDLIACLGIVSTASTGMDIRNNIFSNRATGGNPTPYNTVFTCVYVPSITAMTLTMNNNAYYQGSLAYSGIGQVSTTGSAANLYLAANFNASATTPANNWRAVTTTMGTATNDNASFASTTAPPFVSASDLHIPNATATQLESSGAAAGVTTDIDNQARNATTPDMGADEFNGVFVDLTAPSITYTALSPVCAVTDRAVTGITITDVSGVPTSGTLRPRIYYRKNAGSYFSQPGTLASGTATNGTWDFTIVSADMGGLVAGDIVSYYIIAQDISVPANIASNPSGVVATDVNTVTTHPVTPNTYTIGTNLNGTYTVGAGGNYTTLTSAVAAYNNGCVTGPVIFSLTDATYPTETFPIVINQNAGASVVNTLTIRPAAGIGATISGNNGSSLIKLNGADYIIIDGVNSGGSTLTIQNTNSANTSTVLWIASNGTNGATNNIIRNCTVSGNTGSTTISCIVAGDGATLGAAATAANSNNTMQGNIFKAAQNGIYMAGNTTSFDQNTVINQNTFGSTVAAEKMTFRGLSVQNAQNFTISNNTIAGVVSTTTSSATMTGISVFGLISGGNIFNNKISDIKQTNTTGWGFNGIGLFSTSTAIGLNIYNNFISDVASQGFNDVTSSDNGYGIMVGTGAGYNIYFNTVHLNTNQGANAATGITAAINLASGLAAGAVNLRNNILGSSQTVGANRYAILCSSANTAFSAINFNDYYTSGPNLGIIAAVNRANLAAIIAGFGGNANSVNVTPVYVSGTNLHLDPAVNCLLNGRATPIATITTDIDGDARNTFTPDLGADEFVSATEPTITLGANPAVCVGATSANLTYSATTNTPNQYSIDFDAAAEAQGFVDVVNAALPASPIVITVSGTIPGTYNALLRVTNTTSGCISSAYPITITVNPNNTIALTSAPGTNAQTVCINTAITDITYSTTGATGATFSGLPAGVTGAWAANVVTISGSPTTTVGSPFNYTVTLTGGCGVTTATGSITVTPDNTVTLTSAPGTNAQTVCINTPITNITYSTTGATGATFSGLPAGVSGNWAANVVTISGTPTTTVGSPFNYTVTLTGGCGVITATGSITVTANNTITLSSAPGTDAQSVCMNSPISNIIYTTTGATGATFSGLPAGVTGAWAANVVTISGSPTTTVGSPFSYTVTLTGGCGTVTTNGTITVKPLPVIGSSQVEPTTCVSADGSITLTLSGAVGPYTFAWTGSGVNPTSQNQTGLTVGAYSVTVTAANGCTETANFALSGPGGCSICPTIPTFTTSPSGAACAGANVTFTASGLTDMGITYGIIFKYSAAVLPNPYVGGTVIATIPNGSLTSAGTVATANSATIPAGNYTVYAVLTPTPIDPLCRPAGQVALTIGAVPDVNQPASQTVCNNTATAPVNFTGSVPGTVFNWTNNTTSIGLAASGTGNIASFTATNATNAAVTATITVTPVIVTPVPVNQVFSYTGAMQTFTVPAGVTSVNIQALGAQGGSGAVGGNTAAGGNGGFGASATGTLAVTPGDVLNIFVGGQGATPTGGFNGGGDGGNLNAGGGGGASDVRLGGTGVANRMITAGGGGGGGRGGCDQGAATTGGIGGIGGTGGGGVGANGGDSPTSGGVAGGGFGGNAASVQGAFGAAGIGCGGFLGAPGIATANEIGGNGGSGQSCCCFSFNSIPGGGGGGGGQLGGGGAGGGSAGTTGCVGNSKGAGGGGGGGASYIGGVTSGSTASGVQSGNGLVIITYSAAPITCSGTPKTFTITVNPTPIVNAVTSQTVCNGALTAPVNFTSPTTGPTGAVSFTWTNSNTAIGLAASGTGNIPAFTGTNATAAAISGTITVTPVYTGGSVTCTGTPITFTITVNPTPTVNAQANQVVCVGTVTTATFSGAVAGTVYNWTNTNTAIGLGANGSGNISFTSTNATTAPIVGTITVTPSYTNGGTTCTGTAITFTITVNPTPTVNQPANQSICPGVSTAPVNFTGTVAGTVFNWTNNNITIGLGASGTGNIPAFVGLNPGSTPNVGTITVTPSYTNGGTTCTGTARTFTITVTPNPALIIVADPGSTICEGDPTLLTVYDAAGSGPVSLTQSSSQVPVVGSVSCNAGGLHTDNSYWRAYNLAPLGLPSALTVTNVTFGIEQAAGGAQPVTVRLYTQNAGPAFPAGTRTLVGTQAATVNNASLTTQTVTFGTPVVVPSNAVLIVELFTPSGQATGRSFFIGSNPAAQTGTSYLSAASCGVANPTDVATIGFPNMHIILNVGGTVAATGGIATGTFLWTPAAGLSSTTSNPVAASPQNTTTYTVTRTTVPGGCVASANITINVNKRPVVTTQPASIARCVGTAASFTVGATGTGLTYQWQESATGCAGPWTNLTNGGIYSGATSPTLNINPVGATMNGYAYRCVVSGVCAPWTPPTNVSGCAVLTVNPLPVVTITPPISCGGVAGINGTQLSTASAPPPVPGSVSVSSGTINLAVPDNTANGVSNVIAMAGVPANATITNVSVTFNNFSHTYPGDMIIHLRAPNGAILNLYKYGTGLFTGPASGVPAWGWYGAKVSQTGTTAWSTVAAAPFIYNNSTPWKADAINTPVAGATIQNPTGFVSAATSFADLYTTPASTTGNWTLAMCDGGPGDVGTLGSWNLTIDYTTPGTTNSTLSYVWSPLTGLYNDAGATSPYTGANTPVVYAAPTVFTMYTVTATNTVTGCVNTASAFVNYTPPAPTVTPSSVTMCLGDPAVRLVSSSSSTTTSTVTATSGAISVAIPDGTGAAATSTLNIAGVPTGAGAAISEVKVTMNINHTWVGDVDVNLRAPNNAILNLVGGLDGGAGGNASDNFTNTAFSSIGVTPISGAAAPRTATYAAEGRAGYGPTGFIQTVGNWAGLIPNSAAANGAWTLAMGDFAGGDAGTLTSWTIAITSTVTTGVPSAPAVWTPAAGLFNDAAASSPYVAGTPRDTVWTRPTPAGVYTYQARVNSLPVPPVTFTNPAPITINAAGAASPYPSNLVVAGLPTTGVTVKNVTISGLSHTWSDDVDIVLQSPSGQNVILMSDIGNAGAFSGNNYTFDDAAPAMPPTAAAPPSGTYKPTNFVGLIGPEPDNWTAPGPGAVNQPAPALSTFTGNMNGTWKLFVFDDAAGDGGSISGGFSVGFNLGIAPCTSAPRTVVVTVNQPTTVATQPVNQTICTDKVATFTVVPAGTGPFSYQWQVSTDGGNTYSNVNNGGVYSGATTATLTITAPPVSMSNYFYRVVVTGAAPCASVTSFQARLIVNPLPVVAITPVYSALFPGMTTTLTSTVTPNAASTYTWLRDGVQLTAGSQGVLSGIGTGTLRVDVDGLGLYTLRVTDVNGCTNTSNSAVVKDSASGRCFIYPNPTSGQFQVRYYSIAGNNNLPRGIVVYDAKGDRVFTQNYTVGRPYDRMDVDMRAFGKGLYWVEIVDRNGNRLTMCRAVIQ